jgi:hypothetical protein
MLWATKSWKELQTLLSPETKERMLKIFVLNDEINTLLKNNRRKSDKMKLVFFNAVESRSKELTLLMTNKKELQPSYVIIFASCRKALETRLAKFNS